MYYVCLLTGLPGDYRMPFEDEVGQHPTLEEMQDVVVSSRKRPQFKPHWLKNEVCALLECVLFWNTSWAKKMTQLVFVRTLYRLQLLDPVFLVFTFRVSLERAFSVCGDHWVSSFVGTVVISGDKFQAFMHRKTNWFARHKWHACAMFSF